MLSAGYAFAIAALLSFSFGDTIAKKVSTKYGNYVTALFIMGFGIVPLLVSVYLFPQNLLNYDTLIVALVSGFFLMLGYVLVYKSLFTEQATDTWALINIGPATVVLFGILALGERVDLLQTASVFLIFGGMLLVTVTKELRFNRFLLQAIAGNICWTIGVLVIIFFVAGSTGESLGFILAARGAGFLMLLVYMVAAGKLGKKEITQLKRPNMASISSGLLDGLGQAFLVGYVVAQFVSLGAGLTALEPGVVAILGTAAYKEKLTKLQLFGLAISVVAAVAINFV